MKGQAHRTDVYLLSLSLLVNHSLSFLHKLVVVMQQCSQIQTRCVNEPKTQNTLQKSHTVQMIVPLPNFKTKQWGRKIGSVWLRPLKSCAINPNSPAVWAIPLCSEGREKNMERSCQVRLRQLWKDTVWVVESSFTSTYQIRLLTARVIHFCPTRLLLSPAGRKPPQLLPISSQRTGTPTGSTTSLSETLLPQLHRESALQRKLELKERSFLPPQLFFALL